MATTSKKMELRMGRSTCALVLCTLVMAMMMASSLVSADYTKNDAVVILTEKNFEKEVLNSPDYWIVEFYAPWCGHCKSLEPEYKAAAKKLKQHARLGAVDATAHASLAQKYNIKGYPTIKEFGANKKKPRDYQGGRTRKEIVQYVKNSDEAKKLGVSGVSVDVLDFKSIHTFLTKDETTPTAIFFGSRREKRGAAAKVPAWVGSLAKQFTNEVKTKKKKTKSVPTVRLAFVAGNEGEIAKHFQIDGKLPALVFIDETNSKFLAASGSAIAKEASAKKFIADALKTETSNRDQWETLVPFPAPDVAKVKPRFQLKGLTQQEITKCMSKKGKMCVAVTKSAGETESNTVKELAKRYRRDPVRFLVADTSDPVFVKLTKFLEVPDATAVVIKPGKAIKFIELLGEADEDNLRRFLDRVIDGTTPFKVSTRDVAAFTAPSEDTASTHEEL